METIGNIQVGKPAVGQTTPSHTRGVRAGNEHKMAIPESGISRASARRSTGINARDREPIDPRMPRLSPA
jgi:hypothetical protein